MEKSTRQKGFGQRKQTGREKDDNVTKNIRLVRESRKGTRTKSKEGERDEHSIKEEIKTGDREFSKKRKKK